MDEPYQADFIAEVARYQTFWDQLKSQPFEGHVLTILRALIDRKGDAGTSAREVLKSQLQELPKERWAAALAAGGEPLVIAGQLADSVPLEIGNHLFDALQSMVPELLSNGDVSWRTRWFAAAAYLRGNAKQIVFKAVRDRIYGGNAVVKLAELLATGGDSFLDTAGFSEEPDAAVRHIVLPQLDYPSGFAWLTDHTAQTRAWIVGADMSTREFLAERLQKEPGDGDEEQIEQLHSLQLAWGLAETLGSPANDQEAPSGEKAS